MSFGGAWQSEEDAPRPLTKKRALLHVTTWSCAMTKLPSMPFFPADFFADTAHMTGEAAAIYLVLLGHAWLRGGSLPDDDRLWGRLARISAQRWTSVKPEILPFWELGNDGLVRQKRLARDYGDILKKAETNSKNGLKGNEKRWNRSLFKNNDYSIANANNSGYESRQECDRNQNQNHKEDSLNREKGEERENGLVYVNWDTPQWNAWEAYYRKTSGKSPPKDSKGGWRFPTEYPPPTTTDA
jgi:uncharacterized protein YdaU (DUF1376 family)